MKKQPKNSRTKRRSAKRVPQKERKKNVLALVIISGILLGLLGSGSLKKINLASQLFVAKRLIAQGNCEEAVPKLHQIILADPRNEAAYYQRHRCYVGTSTNNYEKRYKNLVEGINDLDAAILINPDKGDYFVDREYALREFAEILNDSASKFAVYELAVQDSEKAMQLGVSRGKRYVYRHHARNLIESNHCQEGLDETLTLIGQTHTQDPIIETYNIYLTEAYLCLGDLDQALINAEKIECNDPLAMCSSGLSAEIYLQMGENEKALAILDEMIAQQPVTGGWRYFMRAFIHYEEGRKDEALQDIATGEPYTWARTGIYWYVKAKIAEEENDTENYILYLQYAESTLDIHYTLLRKEIQAEMENLGVEPLVIEPTLPARYYATP